MWFASVFIYFLKWHMYHLSFVEYWPIKYIWSYLAVNRSKWNIQNKITDKKQTWLVNNLKRSDVHFCITATGNEYVPTSTLTWANRTEYDTIPTPEIHETVDQTYYTPRIGKKLWYLSAFLVDLLTFKLLTHVTIKNILFSTCRCIFHFVVFAFFLRLF